MSRFDILKDDDSDSADDKESGKTPLEGVRAVPGVGVRQAGGMIINRIVQAEGIHVKENGDINVELGFSDDELSICCHVLTKINDNIELLKLSKLRPLRKALDPIIQNRINKYGETGSSKSRKRERPRCSDNADSKETIRRNMDRKYINKTQLRIARLAELEKLNDIQDTLVPRVPDGVALIENGETLLIDDDGVDRDRSMFIGTLNHPISCYVCFKPFDKLHFFYSSLCPDCAVFNYKKRTEMVDLTGRLCLVTGGRTKIGYRCALKLLRCGARVLVTTRFPYDCISRYRHEKDWNEWKCRLTVFAVDFRNLPTVEKFCIFLCKEYPYLDVIVNNAAQTVRRPSSYYAHLVEPEQRAADFLNRSDPSDEDSVSYVENIRGNLQDNCRFWKCLESIGFQSSQPSDNNPVHLTVSSTEPSHILRPYELSQVEPIHADSSSLYFPRGATDVNGQQVDLRKHNSWTMKLHELSTVEIAEVFAINSIAPTIINSKLKSLMEKSPFKHRFIVNVSAMEGKFYRYKSDKHPHTNMAKAALNMQTRTSAQDYVNSRIYMTAVDTGWINDEKPIDLAVRHHQTNDFQTPLDEIDAAARVLDPIIGPLLAMKEQETDTIEPPFGVFLKDYMKSEW